MPCRQEQQLAMDRVREKGRGGEVHGKGKRHIPVLIDSDYMAGSWSAKIRIVLKARNGKNRVESRIKSMLK
ncbi:hypothetical protein TWF751_002474 [Orbilia oligospora]|nr:hypothetical protein TWF751_002474 [Orbilia oligospora]